MRRLRLILIGFLVVYATAGFLGMRPVEQQVIHGSVEVVP